MTTAIEKQRTLTQSPFEELLNYRRMVAELYARLRRSDLSLEERCRQFRRERAILFGTHPQSALSAEQQAKFRGLGYYPYEPAWWFVVSVDGDVEAEIIEVALKDDGLTRKQRFGRIQFEAGGQNVVLSLFWILGYGGGVFLPFKDLTNNKPTYGGGRYLLDTIKHADLGQEGHKLVLDFNYAYNPSCAYNPRWHCPLAPQENHLPVAVTAGEMQYSE